MPELSVYVNIDEYEYYTNEDIEYIYECCSENEITTFLNLAAQNGCFQTNVPAEQAKDEDDENFTELENLIDKLLKFDPHEFSGLPDEVFDEINKRFGTNFVKPAATTFNFNPELDDEIKLMQQLYKSTPSAELKHEIDLLISLKQGDTK